MLSLERRLHRAFDAGPLFPERHEQFHHVIWTHRAEFELAGAERLERLQIVDSLLLMPEDIAGDGIEVLALRGELDLPLPAMQQLYAEVLFQIADMG